ncbi:Uncharacterised protein [uncultured archaeon]|nr:Uncharacterised protein [uncultured archaeon]
MRMQKEEKVAAVLLLMALGSLAVAFWAFGPEDGASDSTSREKDASLSVQGLVLEVKPTKSGGNLLLKLDSTPLSIFIPASAGAGEVQNKVKIGDRVAVRGLVWEYQGEEELKVARAADVQIIGG